MSDGIETPIFDLGLRDIHVTRIERSGPLCYRIEQRNSKIVLSDEEFLRIAALVKADREIVAQN